MIRLVFTASNTWVGRLIRWITKGKVSHAELQFPLDLWGGDFMAEATFPMVMMVPAEHARRNVIEEYRCKFPVTPALTKVRGLIGEWYDFGGLAVIGWLKIWWRILHRKFRSPLHNARAQFCSEFLARFLMAAELPGTSTWNPERITPEDLRQYCERNPELFEKIAAEKLAA